MSRNEFLHFFLIYCSITHYLNIPSLTPPKSISIVGTRHCTEYGKELCRRFVSDLRKAVPDVQIISGLAYGIDIEAHRNALDSGLDTIGVLAHGLDQIYPSSHRSTAIKMLGRPGAHRKRGTQKT